MIATERTPSHYFHQKTRINLPCTNNPIIARMYVNSHLPNLPPAFSLA